MKVEGQALVEYVSLLAGVMLVVVLILTLLGYRVDMLYQHFSARFIAL